MPPGLLRNGGSVPPRNPGREQKAKGPALPERQAPAGVKRLASFSGSADVASGQVHSSRDAEDFRSDEAGFLGCQEDVQSG